MMPVKAEARDALHQVAFADSREERLEILLRYAVKESAEALLELFVDLAELSEQVVENGKQHAIDLLIQETDLHPYSAEKLNYPSLKGALVGLKAVERVPAHARERPCLGCAYRAGTVANQCFDTQQDTDSVLESSHSFLCHARGTDEATGEPTKPCIGHVYAAKAHAKACMEDRQGPKGEA
tara:strand:- start:381 stop:926 length:546 start_codon:yes stop_codon:yes gene_type:complete